MVYGAGFGEVASGLPLEDELTAAARRHGLPVCGPNGNGIVQMHERLALWGDALNPLEAGRVALVSQSGNVAVNALATRRGLRLHTVVSCGNSSTLDPAEWIAELALDEGVGSIAIYLEADGDGARLCEALAVCAERGVGVAVLKVGTSSAGAAAAAAHTGAVAGDQRVFRALVEEAGGAWAEDVHELLEMAKALAVADAHVPRRPPARRTPAARPSGSGRPRRRPADSSGAGRPRNPHLLRRRLRPRRRRVRAHRPVASAARRRRRGAAPRDASRRRHGRQPARLHRADLGPGGHAA